MKMRNGKSVLLTGGRAAFGLDLARYFNQAGYQVYVADSWKNHFACASNAVKKVFQVTAPRIDLVRYGNELLQIVKEYQISEVIPVSEEVFYLSSIAPLLRPHARVWTDTPEKLRRVHHKGEFVALARSFGLAVPETHVAHSREELREAITLYEKKKSDFVLKPAFSRFADQALFSWKSHFSTRLAQANPTLAHPWLIQERILGEELCTYSLAEKGRILAHVNYSHEFTAGAGAGISFESIERPELNAWVAEFARATEFTGQLAFDFILPLRSSHLAESGHSQAYAIECNPRGTSGIHFFYETNDLVHAFTSPEKIDFPKTPRRGLLGMTTFVALFVYGIPQIHSFTRLHKWFRVVCTARDALLEKKDLCPFFAQFKILFHLLGESRKTGKSMLACSTQDIEWNGEPLS